MLHHYYPDDEGLLTNPESIYYAKSKEWALQNALSRELLFGNYHMTNYHSLRRRFDEKMFAIMPTSLVLAFQEIVKKN